MCWGLEAELGAHFLGPLWWHHWIWAQDSGLPQLRLQSFLPTHELCGPRQTLTLFKPWIPRQDTSSPFLRALFWEGQYTGKHPHTEAGVCGGPDSGATVFIIPAIGRDSSRQTEADGTPWPQGLGPAACLFLVQTHGSESTLQTWDAAGSLPSPTSQDREEKARTA